MNKEKLTMLHSSTNEDDYYDDYSEAYENYEYDDEAYIASFGEDGSESAQNDIDLAVYNAVKGILSSISAITGAVIAEMEQQCAELMKDKEARKFVKKTFTQWKYGYLLTNPLVLFTQGINHGDYDNLDLDITDQIHDAAVKLSVLWRSKPELNIDGLKSNLGYLIVQKTILKILGGIKAEDADMKTLLEQFAQENYII